eukprot:scaffold69980_cov79-Cyclotella_meneghiniana.AAC.3
MAPAVALLSVEKKGFAMASLSATSVSREESKIAKPLGLTCHDSPHSHPSSPDDPQGVIHTLTIICFALPSSCRGTWFHPLAARCVPERTNGDG